MRPFLFVIITIFTALLLAACSDKLSPQDTVENPPASGFNLQESDPRAIAIADAVMKASGTRQGWDETRYVKWNFFDARRHIWDKYTNELRMIGIKDSFDIRMNLDSLTGRVQWHGDIVTQPDSLAKYLQLGREMWINDSYWVFLPFKLKDSGVTLKYMGQDTMKSGIKADVISLAFEDVGVTPDNKYYIYVDSSNMVRQWDFFPNYQDTIPRFSTPWQDYASYGKIKLSSSRGDGYTISELAVGDSLRRYFE